MTNIEKLVELREIAIKTEEVDITYKANLLNAKIAHNAELLAIEVSHALNTRALDSYRNEAGLRIVLDSMVVLDHLYNYIRSTEVESVSKLNRIVERIDTYELFVARIAEEEQEYLVRKSELEAALRKYVEISPNELDQGDRLTLDFQVNLDAHTLKKETNTGQN